MNKGTGEEQRFEERDVPGRVYQWLKRVLEEQDVTGGATGVLFLFVALLRVACSSRFVRRPSFVRELSLPLLNKGRRIVFAFSR